MNRFHDNVAILFGSPEDFFAAMFGPPQHDVHVVLFRRLEARRQLAAERPARDASVKAFVAEVIEDEREKQAQRAAEQHNFNTAVIRQQLHRWEAGCFSREPFAPIRARQLRRALDIAIAHHDAANLQAAE